MWKLKLLILVLNVGSMIIVSYSTDVLLTEITLNLIEIKWGGKYSSDIRRVIYTTNVIESFNSQIRKFRKTREFSEVICY